MPRLVEFLLGCGIKDPVVCSAINKIGFQMNPDIASYEEALQTKPFQALEKGSINLSPKWVIACFLIVYFYDAAHTRILEKKYTCF